MAMVKPGFYSTRCRRRIWPNCSNLSRRDGRAGHWRDPEGIRSRLLQVTGLPWESRNWSRALQFIFVSWVFPYSVTCWFWLLITSGVSWRGTVLGFVVRWLENNGLRVWKAVVMPRGRLTASRSPVIPVIRMNFVTVACVCEVYFQCPTPILAGKVKGSFASLCRNV